MQFIGRLLMFLDIWLLVALLGQGGWVKRPPEEPAHLNQSVNLRLQCR